jgi:hypothetical protein
LVVRPASGKTVVVDPQLQSVAPAASAEQSVAPVEQSVQTVETVETVSTAPIGGVVNPQRASTGPTELSTNPTNASTKPSAATAASRISHHSAPSTAADRGATSGVTEHILHSVVSRFPAGEVWGKTDHGFRVGGSGGLAGPPPRSVGSEVAPASHTVPALVRR